MKKTVQLQAIEHRGEQRIKVLMPNREDYKTLIKQVKGRKWSQTKRCWHLPYTKAAFQQVQELFDEVITIQSPKPPKQNTLKSAVEPPPKAAAIAQKKIPPSTPANREQQLPQSPIPPTHLLPNEVLIPSEVQYISYQRQGEEELKIVGQHIIFQTNKKQDVFYAFVPYDKKGWLESIRNIPGRKWMPHEKCWQLPYVKASFRLIKKFIGMKYCQFLFKINPNIPEEAPPEKRFNRFEKKYKRSYAEQLNDLQKAAIILLMEKLTLERLAESTKKSYKQHLIGLFLFYKDLAPQDITKKQVQHYLIHLIRFKKIAESTQNQIINAIKAYWERVLLRGKEFIEIPRPKRPKQLPNVLSTEEVVEIMNVSINLKHKLALLLIYSAGLRKGELLNLLKRDINIKRRSIHIKGGKGKKDRYVALAETVIPYLKQYLKQYQPARWLFEGQNGGQYSGSSLQKIFEHALKQSKVNPYASLHTLRHSYATHCVESGHNLKSVQEALGHRSLKTTEIYLHISSLALKKLKSPLDNLDIK